MSNHNLEKLVRLPGKCLSLIYCTSGMWVEDIISKESSKFLPNQIIPKYNLASGFSLIFSFKKFKSKKLWIKLILLTILRRKFWVAENNSSILGIVGARFDRISQIKLIKNESCIYTVIISEDYRRIGIGSHLVEIAVIELIKKGYDYIYLEVGEHNNNMINLINGLGLFKLCGVFKRPLPIPTPKSIF